MKSMGLISEIKKLIQEDSGVVVFDDVGDELVGYQIEHVEERIKDKPEDKVEKGSNINDVGKSGLEVLTEKDLGVFREINKKLREDVERVKGCIEESSKLREIMGEDDRLKAMEQFYVSLGKRPERLIESGNFVHKSVPYLAGIMEVYVKIEQEEIKSDKMRVTLEESLVTIERLADEIVEDYLDYVGKYVGVLNEEINKVNIYLEGKSKTRELYSKK